MLQYISKYKTFLRFCVVGGIATSLDFGIYLFLTHYIGPIVSKTISMSCSMVLSYTLNKIWSFSCKDTAIRKELGKYLFAQGINLITNVSVNTVALYFTQNKLVSFLLATAIAMAVNYLLQKNYVFKNTTKS